MDNFAPLLEARDLHKIYRQGPVETPVLRGINLKVKRGEFLAILGPSGSGKSTLLHLLGLMDRPTRGEVLIAGAPTSALDETARAVLRNRRLGFVFQFDSLLPEFSALENVLLPGQIAGRQDLKPRALELLAKFGLERLAGRLPQEMSGGERQRTAIARALLNKPDLLFADEPTGNLDRRNGELVFNTLRAVAEEHGVAVVLVTHNEEAAACASTVLHLADGAWQEPAAYRQG
jgi:lipoprotein-releasing system ATP-binding protein